MHDNTNIDFRCRALWSEVLSAVHSRVSSVNAYVPEKRSHIECEVISPEAICLRHTSSERALVASLDLKKHSIQVKQYCGHGMETLLSARDLLLSLLADGEVYVTDGNELKGTAAEVAKTLVDTLLAIRSVARMSA